MNCDSSWPFDPSSVSSLMGALNKYWPDLLTQAAQYSFWEHEARSHRRPAPLSPCGQLTVVTRVLRAQWSKHGTCAAKDDTKLTTQMLYFNQTLALRSQYDIYGTLLNANIVVRWLRACCWPRLRANLQCSRPRRSRTRLRTSPRRSRRRLEPIQCCRVPAARISASTCSVRHPTNLILALMSRSPPFTMLQCKLPCA
jgi:hypothetical protein